jgi:hypothetical protein
MSYVGLSMNENHLYCEIDGLNTPLREFNACNRLSKLDIKPMKRWIMNLGVIPDSIDIES